MGSAKEVSINLRKMAENVGLDEDEYLPLLVLFVETSIRYLEEIKSHILNGDSIKVYETIHNIRGAAENLGIPEMSEIAKIMELKARENVLEGAEEAREYLVEKLGYLTAVSHLRYN
ncbi:MAG: Hpt domain-containing protein [Syntrophales bacterium]|jgi:HPt (histidine-containing phosphotransfer) domain-containing protein